MHTKLASAVLLIGVILAAIGVYRPLRVAEPCRTETGAATVALRIAADLTTASGFEYGGYVAHDQRGCYTASVAVTSMSANRVIIRVPADNPARTVTAIYHTHPGKYELVRVFSHEDITTAESYGWNSYIGVVHYNEIRRYVPGHSRKRPMPGTSPLARHYVSSGILLGRIEP